MSNINQRNREKILNILKNRTILISDMSNLPQGSGHTPHPFTRLRSLGECSLSHLVLLPN